MQNENNLLSHRAKMLLFSTLEIVRKELRGKFSDWKDADDWLFGHLDFTKNELAQIYEGRDTLYYDGSAVDDEEPADTPVATETCIIRIHPNFGSGEEFCVTLPASVDATDNEEIDIWLEENLAGPVDYWERGEVPAEQEVPFGHLTQRELRFIEKQRQEHYDGVERYVTDLQDTGDFEVPFEKIMETIEKAAGRKAKADAAVKKACKREFSDKLLAAAAKCIEPLADGFRDGMDAIYDQGYEDGILAVLSKMGLLRSGGVRMSKYSEKYGECAVCGWPMAPVWFTEEETVVIDGTLHKTGRKRRAVSHLTCTNCLTNECVDDSFDKPWTT